MKNLHILLLCALSLVSAFNNIPPIPERHPGWGEGKGRLLINIEIFSDLTCDGCSMLHDEFQKFLNNMTYLGSPVRDLVFVNYAFFGLPYHHASWIPHRLLPYIIDQCLSTKVCKFNDYVTYAFSIRDSFLESTNTPYDTLVQWWIRQTNSQFGWSQSDLQAVYNRTTPDPHNSEARSRWMWKYAAVNGVFGTPTAFVNGVRVQNIPWTATDWLKLLDDVYKTQKVTF